jgi:hypothetical protein
MRSSAVPFHDLRIESLSAGPEDRIGAARFTAVSISVHLAK